MGLDMYLIRRKRDLKKDYWDFDKEEIYWRKANMVHKFFCDNGEEIEEQVIYKISKENLQELLDKCNEVLEKVILKEGKIQNGSKYNSEKKEWEPILEDGEYIANEEEIANILPTTSGFFFGSTDYDEYYLKDIKYTKENIEKLLNYMDFDEEECYYLASW